MKLNELSPKDKVKRSLDKQAGVFAALSFDIVSISNIVIRTCPKLYDLLYNTSRITFVFNPKRIILKYIHKLYPSHYSFTFVAQQFY